MRTQLRKIVVSLNYWKNAVKWIKTIYFYPKFLEFQITCRGPRVWDPWTKTWCIQNKFTVVKVSVIQSFISLSLSTSPSTVILELHCSIHTETSATSVGPGIPVPVHFANRTSVKVRLGVYLHWVNSDRSVLFWQAGIAKMLQTTVDNPGNLALWYFQKVTGKTGQSMLKSNDLKFIWLWHF